ncbi:MAG: N(4)-(beta-N-acetylglucosaminyl)-L-asparaginase [Saprospiraceae bacterium]|nr:N(4)-(beta-N-acetylglucosaminyl)-L-asparaginase [Saprospiraceae bacterium]
MTTNRRTFLHRTFFTGITTTLGISGFAPKKQRSKAPLVVATWNNEKACQAAYQVLDQQGNALDAVEQGVMIPEADPNDRSVGYGGRPDRDGKVTVDSCIMDAKGQCGSVVFLEDILHPVQVARKVMEQTPHVILAGEGAQQFALANGFEKQNLLTEDSRKEWQEWLKNAAYKPVINIENHDTIGMLTQDAMGDLAGACTTSGAAYKMRGRVGDSPIIGAGLYVDNTVGSATGTGLGEALLRTLGSFLVVEFMRQGDTPQKACEKAIKRVVDHHPGTYQEFQIGLIATDIYGRYGGYSIQPGFSYFVINAKGGQLIKSRSYL